MILLYLLKFSACIALFYGLYHFWLSKFTFFNLNRAYLILMMLLSAVIPVLTIEKEREIIIHEQATTVPITYSQGEATESDFDGQSQDKSLTINWPYLIESTYYLILLLMIGKTVLMLLRIRYQLNKQAISYEGNLIWVGAHSKIKNCSFLNKIVIDITLSADERQLVIQHEKVHVNQFHAIDKLFANVICALLWFNPVVYFWRNAIDHNHEFLADRAVSQLADKRTYASLLLNLATPSSRILINSFSKLPLKNRIMMLYKKPNTRFQKLAYVTIAPVLLVCCMAFINRKEVFIEKKLQAQEIYTDAPQNQNVYTRNYLNDEINVNPNGASAFKEVEIVLVLDAGHGGRDDTATALDGQKEKDLNLRAVRILQQEAKKRGIKVLLTRDNDQYIPLRDRLPLQLVTAFISIHHNDQAPSASLSKPFGGIELYVSKEHKNIKATEDLGALMLAKLKNNGGMEVRDSLKNANLLLLRETKAPAVLIELGNIKDKNSLNYINEESNIRKISNLILDGFLQFTKRGC